MSESTTRTEPPFVFVTGNAGKRREAERLLGRPLTTVDVDLPEIQGLDLESVLVQKARDAQAQVGGTVLVEETGLELAAMNGFPGPLVKWMLEAMGAEGIARTAAGLGELAATATCALAHFDGERMLIAHGATRGRLVTSPRGRHGFGWDPVFVPEGGAQTYAELGDEVKDEIGHRGRAWRALREVLTGAGLEL
ncbi:MAG: non-canonical purine NTP pyrophosphatase [Acidobacteriota bacterium]